MQHPKKSSFPHHSLNPNELLSSSDLILLLFMISEIIYCKVCPGVENSRCRSRSGAGIQGQAWHSKAAGVRRGIFMEWAFPAPWVTGEALHKWLPRRFSSSVLGWLLLSVPTCSHRLLPCPREFQVDGLI